MGLFEKLKGSKPVELTPKSALAMSAISLIAADGVIDEAELTDLAKIVRGDKNAIDNALQVLQSTPFPDMITIVANCLNGNRRLPLLRSLLIWPWRIECLRGMNRKSYRRLWKIWHF
jgi:hypothetical protein